jgi:hypothetical protein
MSEFLNSETINQYISGLVEQLNAPLDAIKQWLMVTPLNGKEDEVHTLNHLLAQAQKQVTVQIQLLSQFVQSQVQEQNAQLFSSILAQVAVQSQTPVVKLDENQLMLLLNAIQVSNTGVTGIPIHTGFTPTTDIDDDDLPF